LYCSDAPTQQLIDDWLADGDIEHLEQLVLDGRGHLLLDKSSNNEGTMEFLHALKQYQVS
jgi:hypothetical protein